MYNIIGKKHWFFIISGLVVIPGLVSLILWGVKLSIDFTGGSLLELQFTSNPPGIQKIEEVVKNEKIELVSISQTREKSYLLRLTPVDKDKNILLQKALTEKIGKVNEVRFETVGPTIGQETTNNAVKAVIVASFAIIIYI